MEQAKFRLQLSRLTALLIVLLVLGYSLTGMILFTSIAFADENDAAQESSAITVENEDADLSDISAGSDEEIPVVVDGISYLAIYYKDTATSVGDSNRPNLRDTTIREKAGKVEFYTVAGWDDDSDTTDDYRVEWESSDTNVCRVYGGIVEAVADGTAEVRAFVTAENNPNGQVIEASTTIVVVGQGDSVYVTDIIIASSDGEAIPQGEPHVVVGELGTTQEQFYALVTVYDASLDESRVYSTYDGLLSEQIEGMGDVQWYVGDPAMASVESAVAPGLWRPVVYGISALYAYTNAGFGNERIATSVSIAMRDPSGGAQDDEYHPQDSITVLAYYELYKPNNMHDISDKRFVINQTYSLDDLMAMGVSTQTYTALSSGSYYTITGNGVPLAVVLTEAGVNLEGINKINFGTVDSLDRPISYSYIVGTDRYYFPNIDVGSWAEAVQVFPILAYESSISRNAGTEPDYHMSEGTRFRLLFGSTPNRQDNTSQYQIKWIHTLYVELKGAPAVESGNEGSGSDNAGNAPKPGDNNGNNAGNPFVDTPDSGNNSDGGTSDADSLSGNNVQPGDSIDDGAPDKPAEGSPSGSKAPSGNTDNTTDEKVTQGSVSYGDSNISEGKVGEKPISSNVSSVSSDGDAKASDEPDTTSDLARDQKLASGVVPENQSGNNADTSNGEAELMLQQDARVAENAIPAEGINSANSLYEAAAKHAGKYQIYQIMNSVDSITNVDFDYYNPYKPAAAVGGMLMLGLGGLYSLLWFRHQSKIVEVVMHTKAAL